MPKALHRLMAIFRRGFRPSCTVVMHALIILIVGGSVGTMSQVTLRNAFAASDEQIVLEGLSDQGTFKVELHWLTSGIGKPNSFNIVFRDNDTNTVIEAVRYNWDVSGPDLQQSTNHRTNQTSGSQLVTFPASGSYTVRISDIEGLGEGIAFHIEVVPEMQNTVIPWVLVLGLIAPVLIAKR